ncbi:MAG: septum formation initiator family protein [Actinomycetota bacterium]
MTVPVAPRPPERDRPRFTSRAAVLAVVLCAIALSLAYPVREYIGQRRQIDQLTAQREAIEYNVHRLQAQDRNLTSPAYVEQQARDRLHMCLPKQTCYVVIAGKKYRAPIKVHHQVTPWYERLWHTVQTANKAPAP